MRITTMHLVMSEVRQGGYIRISNAHPDEPGTYIQGVSPPTGGKACKREPAPQLGQREDKGTTKQVNIFRSCYRLTQPLGRGSNNRLLLPYTSIYKGEWKSTLLETCAFLCWSVVGNKAELDFSSFFSNQRDKSIDRVRSPMVKK